MNILSCENLEMHFPVTAGLLKKKIGAVKAVDGVSFSINTGQTLGLVGESGSGKSTIGNCILRRHTPTEGRIIFQKQDVAVLSGREVKKLRKDLQMITQDPYSSLDPRFTIKEILLEGPMVHRLVKGKGEQNDLVFRMLETVGLDSAYANRFPHEFSGGERQRICIARSLALNPSFIVCDEIVSSLDVSIQAQIIDLMADLQERLGLSLLFIGHDLAVVRQISHQIAVLYLGKIVEMTSSAELYDNPLHPYTKALLSAVPIPNPKADRARERILLGGEIPSPIHPPNGCRFHTRCPEAEKICGEKEPAFTDFGGGHFAACHHIGGMGGVINT